MQASAIARIIEGVGSACIPVFRSAKGMERREAPGGLRDLLWRSLAIGPAGRPARPPAPDEGAAPPGAPPEPGGAYDACGLQVFDRLAPHECSWTIEQSDFCIHSYGNIV